MPKADKTNNNPDFLMTYGWTLLLIILIVGALLALGIIK